MEPVFDNVILYDGHCRFCGLSVQFILRHDRRKKFRLVPLQTKLGAQLATAHGQEAGPLDTLLLLTPTGALTRSDAVIEIVRGFGGLWSLCGCLRWIPRPVRDWLYSIVARNRYRWFGRMDSCAGSCEDLPNRFPP